MGKIGCGIDRNLKEANLSEAIPWIGLYVAAASLVCAIAMAVDVIRGFRQQKFWFPSKFFSINATSLTIIAVAVKWSMDLNTAMPRQADQLAKLSSSVLLWTVMDHSMPSLGTMDDNEIFTNILAFGILIITVVVKIGIQLGTGAIYLQRKEHVFIMFLMLILLEIFSFSALIMPMTKKYLEAKNNKKFEMALNKGLDETDKRSDKKLKENLMKFWMMTHTRIPIGVGTIAQQSYGPLLKLAHDAKNQSLNLCIGVQTGILLGSKVIQFISVYIVHWILVFSEFSKIKKLNPSDHISSDSGSESQSSSKLDLSHFVLRLEGEGELVDLMMTNNFDATDHWLQRGKKDIESGKCCVVGSRSLPEVARHGSSKTVTTSRKHKEVLEGLADAAKNRLEEYKKIPVNQCRIESPSNLAHQVKELGRDHFAESSLGGIVCKYTNKEMAAAAHDSGMEVVTRENERVSKPLVLEGSPSRAKDLSTAYQDQTSRYYKIMKQFVETCELAAEKDVFRSAQWCDTRPENSVDRNAK
ncbi:unnamed protein product [Dovyalis caffra]|uniref:DUF4220 domain-containing protein n=1 Tax=Dovyalis caffra TaxID=77055 RepID=A0AAV1SS78_9ROSI|nr:unnamed protein product [Dovyalis caffra]